MIDIVKLRSDVVDLKLEGRRPRVHGNGFIQLDLDSLGEVRLHVWDDRVPRQASPTPIHDHVFALRSEVLCGTLIHEELSVHAAHPDQGGTHRVYHAEQEPGSQNTVLVPNEMFEFDVRLEQRLIMGAGSIYLFPVYTLHQTDHRGTTVTVMKKEKHWSPTSGGWGGYGRPRVLVPVGAEPDNDFHRDGFDQEFLWEIIEEALGEVET